MNIIMDNGMQHQQYQSHHRQGKRARLSQAIRRLFKRRTPTVPVISAGARMSLALAIAEQYVLVSQDCPIEQSPATTVCGTVAASPVSGYKYTPTYCGDEATLASDRRTTRKSLLMFVRPRTASGSTICEEKCVNACCCSMVASRENPICC